MRILQVHNYYQSRGGEDETADQEVALLKELGHEVEFYSRHNDEIKDYSLLKQCGLLFNTSWSRRTYRDVTHLIKSFSPDIVHVQNFFPLISPSIFYACRDAGTPVCLTLHDYRLICPIGWLYRNSAICTECIDSSPWRVVQNRCYHDSAIKSLPIAIMLKAHWQARTWEKCVTAYSAMTATSRDIFAKAGLPLSKILLRPHFLTSDPGAGRTPRDGVVFVGRLSREKGVEILLEAWKGMPDIPLTIIGDGPMRSAMETLSAENNMTNVTFMGFMPPTTLLEYVQKARLLVMPSQWHETFGRTIMEAFATGTPVVASRLGALQDLVVENETGFLFTHDNVDHLSASVRRLYTDQSLAAAMGEKARNIFEKHFATDVGGTALIDFYNTVIGMHKRQSADI